ncbi:MAG: LacI family DNA-binding transcriptional regulator [Gaiella sp.]
MVNLRYPENAEVVAATRRHCTDMDCPVLIADANAFVGRKEIYTHLLRERRIDGLLVGTLLPTTDDLAPLARERLPLVLVSRRIPWLAPGVAADETEGLRLAVDHLLRLGHHRIAYITGPGASDTVGRRLEGFQQAIASAGLDLRADYVVSSSADPEEGPAHAMTRLLRLVPRPTAVVLWTVGDAAGALHAVRHEGLSVPRDLSLVAINDAATAAYLSPPVTVVRMPIDELTGRAVDRLLDVVRGGPATGDVLITTPPVLMERGSAGPPPT